MRHRLHLLALVAVVALTLAACSDGDDEPSDAGGTTAEATGPTETTATGATGATETVPAGSATVTTADSGLGEIVVDADGRTLYVFLPDEGGASTCYDDCEATWPPLLVDAEATGDGVDASLLGTAEREDGSLQATLDGWPLYYFGDDAAPGDTNGQGIGEVWYVVAPDGTQITEAA